MSDPAKSTGRVLWLAVGVVVAATVWFAVQPDGEDPVVEAAAAAREEPPPTVRPRQRPTTLPAVPVTSPPTTTEAVVIYEVLGSGGATVTYGAAGFSQEQQHVTLPWRHELRGDVPDYPVLLAQLDGTGSVTCKVWGGGTVPLAEATSSGAYVIASCVDD